MDLESWIWVLGMVAPAIGVWQLTRTVPAPRSSRRAHIGVEAVLLVMQQRRRRVVQKQNVCASMELAQVLWWSRVLQVGPGAVKCLRDWGRRLRGGRHETGSVLATDGQPLVSELRQRQQIHCLPLPRTRRPSLRLIEIHARFNREHHGRGGVSFACSWLGGQ